MKNKAYSALLMTNTIPGSNVNLVMELNNERRKIWLRSIIYEVRLQNAVTGEEIPINENRTINHVLFVRPANNENPLLCFPFQNPTIPAVMVSSGLMIEFYNPLQKFFKNLWFNQRIEFVWNVMNKDLIESIDVFGQVIAEIDEE